jgi:hypothetical protein
MQPFTVVLGILLGSVVSIAFSLAVVLLIFFFQQEQQPRLASELPELFRATVAFSLLSVLAGAAFVGSLRGTSWRRWPSGLLFLGLAAVGWYYWPD